MSPITKNFLTGGAAVLLWGATSLAASAYYMGYANGDPGNWDFYQEQHNGASPPAAGGAAPVASHHGHIVYHGHVYDHGTVRTAPRSY
jgi:hypothetical protein